MTRLPCFAGHFRCSTAHKPQYAGSVGDCNGRSLLTHMGKHQARLAGDAILGRPVADLAVVPRVTFTDPQVCAVGRDRR